MQIELLHQMHSMGLHCMHADVQDRPRPLSWPNTSSFRVSLTTPVTTRAPAYRFLAIGYMASWVWILLVVAIVAAILGFGGVFAVAAGLLKIIFWVAIFSS